MGIQINGATDSITAIDGTIDVVSAIGNAGVLTATAFVGNITGNVTGNINHTSNLELQTGGVTRAHFNSSGHFGIAGISTFTETATFNKISDSISMADSLVHTGNTGTKLQFHTNAVELHTSGSQRLRINSAGNLIFTSPNNNTGEQPAKLEWWNENSAGIMGKISLVREAVSQAPGALAFYTSPNVDTSANSGQGDITERLRITSAGRLQIGLSGMTGGDDQALVVNNPITDNKVLELSTANATGRINFSRTLSNTLNTTSYIEWGEPGAQGTGDLKFGTSAGSNNPTERLRITSDGKVGINDNNPANQLVVKAPGGSGHTVTSVMSGDASTRVTMQAVQGTEGRMGMATNHPLAIYAGALERLRITAGGNVEIGSGSGTGSDFSLLDGMVINTANGSAGLIINSSSSSHNAYLSFGYGSGSGTSHADQYSAYIGRVGDDTLILGTQNNIRATLTSGGQFVVGGTSSQASDAVTLMPDGEVTAAGFYFSNNIGSAMNACGIRRHTTNTMVFDTASTERLRIDADGNTSTKGSAMEHFVNKRVQSINSNGNSVQYVLVAPTGTNNLRLQGKFHFTRATGTSGIAQQTVEAQIMTNNTGGDAQYYVRTATTDQGSYSGMYYRWVTCDYNSTTYYALEGHPVTGSSYWGGFMQHGVYTGTANECTNLGTVLNTTSHSITNISALTTRKAHERWYNTNLNVQFGALYVKQGSGLNGGYFAPTYYDVNGAALPTQMKVHGQKAVCIDCTRYYTSGDIITFRINNDYEGAIYVNPSGVQYNTTSDYRLKENVINLTGAIDRVKQLKPKRFNFIKDPGNTIDGFMAHEVSSVVPNAVVGEKDAVKDILYEENDEVIPEGKKVGDVKEKDAIDPQSMDDSKLVPLLTAALQEAIAKIETLETKVAALEGS